MGKRTQGWEVADQFEPESGDVVERVARALDKQFEWPEIGYHDWLLVARAAVAAIRPAGKMVYDCAHSSARYAEPCDDCLAGEGLTREP